METPKIAPEFRWHFLNADSPANRAIAKEAGLPYVCAQILHNRKTTLEELDVSLNDLMRPEQLPDYEKARDAIFEARDKGHRVLVYGDYDADGLCGTALLIRLLKHLEIDAIPFIPDRLADGYSLGPKTLELAQKENIELMITVDNGTTAINELKELKEAGIKVIVVDHHQAKEELPECTALLNPWLISKNEEGEYPFFVEYCGAATAFILAWGVMRDHYQEEKLKPSLREFLTDLLPYAAIATISDVMPLRGANRALVTAGLKRLPYSRFPGMAALAQTVFHNKDLVAADIGFRIAPLINAAGRLFQASASIDLLLCDKKTEAQVLITKLTDLNEERKALTQNQIDLLMGKALKQHQTGKQAIVVGDHEAHFGVLGIVAAKIMEHTQLPTFCWAECDGGQVKGSARVPKGQSAIQLLDSAASVLNKYGGHNAAAGFELDIVDVETLKEKIHSSAGQDGPAPPPELLIDLEVSAQELGLSTCKKINSFEPYGRDFPKPIFAASKVLLTSTPRIVGASKNVMQFQLRQNDVDIRGVAFRFPESYKKLEEGDTIDVAFEAELNHFRGRTTVQWRIIDLRTNTCP
jgi:single-stranded-DNA-specific exonuclease